MAKQVAQAGVLTCVLQYSLYPDALAPQMVDELSQALTWTFNNISQHGGNPNQVTSPTSLQAVFMQCCTLWVCGTAYLVTNTTPPPNPAPPEGIITQCIWSVPTLLSPDPPKGSLG